MPKSHRYAPHANSNLLSHGQALLFDDAESFARNLPSQVHVVSQSSIWPVKAGSCDILHTVQLPNSN